MKKIINSLNIYGVVAISSIFILTIVLQLWQADLRIPITVNAGDTLFNLMCIKGLKGSGWYFHNKFLGAPFGLDLHDLPMADSLHLLILKILVLLRNNSALALNLYFIAIFPLNAIAACFVFRCLKISRSVSIVISLLYAFLPYAFLRGQAHLFLTAYYTIPLITLVTLSLWSDNLPLLANNQDYKSKFRWQTLTTKKSLFCIIVCLVIGSTGVYYAFFSCFFLAVASVSAFIYKRDKRIFISALILITIIFISFFLNVLPSLIYTYQNGENLEVAQRDLLDTESFGLKVTNLLLPIIGHRFLSSTSSVTQYQQANNGNENLFAALGIITGIGFLSLLFRSIFLSSQKVIENSLSLIYNHLALLNMAALLFAIVGGFGTIFSLFVTPLIRGTNRISIFIAFFSLLAIALFLDSIKKKYVKNKKHKIIFNIVLIGGLLFGILDQTSPAFIPNYIVQKNEHINDKVFVNSIEKVLSPNSMVFQLPYVPFPENPPLNLMNDYDLFKGYIHSENLGWSYGAMKGRGLNWQKTISKEPLNILLQKISALGFAGIYIDRYGYVDLAKNIESDLEKYLEIKPLISKNKRLAFFNVTDFNEKFLPRHTKEEIEAYKWIVLNPIQVQWENGFYTEEENLKEGKWRWSKKQSFLILNNPSSKVRKLAISMSLATVWKKSSNLKIAGDLFEETLKINNKPLLFSKTISLPPGKHLIKFSSNAPPLNTAIDPRELAFTVYNAKIKEEQAKNFENSDFDNLNSKEIEWKEGFYPQEQSFKAGTWRWSNKQSTLIINNSASVSKEAEISITLQTSWQDYSNLRIESKLFSDVIKINAQPSTFSQKFLLPPGKHEIKFTSDAQPANNAPGDTRKLFFRVNKIVL
jgi:phosphoglycerol transferase